MKRLLRLLLWLIWLAVVLVAVTAAWNWDVLLRLYNVNTLFREDRIVANFSSMKDLFYWTPIRRHGDLVPWPTDRADLPEAYIFEGMTKSVAEWLERTDTTSFVVVRNGAIAYEDYRLGTRQEDLRISWSMAKSFLSAIFGVAVSDGHIRSLNDTVDVYAPLLKGTVYEGVTIRNVLNMASGVSFNEDYLDYNSDINRMGRVLALGFSMDAFAAGLEARERPQGNARQYTSIDTHVLAMVLRGATGRQLPQLLEDILWSQLGVESDGYYLTDGHGVAFALGGLNFVSRDYARFGQMMLDYGRFNGRQVIPAAWAEESVRPNAPPSVDPNDSFGYGYQWWVPLGADDEFYAIGIYGQFIYVNRPARVVIVKTSADRGFRDDGANGNRIEAETIEMFRSIAAALTGWRPPAGN